MNLTNLRAEVAANLGKRDDITTQGYIDTAVNYILREDLPFRGLVQPYKTSTESFSTTASQEYVDISSLTGFVGIIEDTDEVFNSGVTIADGDNWRTLYRLTQDMLSNEDESEPDYYEIRWSSTSPYLYLRPIPDAVYSLQIWYYAKETTLSSGTDESTLSQVYGDGPLIAGATWRVAQKLNLQDLEDRWGIEYFGGYKGGRRVVGEVPKLLAWQEKMQGGEKYLVHPYL